MLRILVRILIAVLAAGALFSSGLARAGEGALAAANAGLAEDEDDPAPVGKIKAMRFVGHGVAWAVRITGQSGLEILRTADDTKTWQTRVPNDDWLIASTETVAYAKKARRHDALMLDLYAQDANTAWAVIGAKRDDKRAAYVLGTRDAGKHWTGSWLPLAEDVEVLNVEFTDATKGFVYERLRPAAGELLQRIYRTHDAGVTWSELVLPDKKQFPGLQWEACSFRTPSDGWLVHLEAFEGQPAVFCTHDGGTSWRAESLDIPENLRRARNAGRLPQFLGEHKREGILGISVQANEPDADLMIFYRTLDGGLNWTRAGSPSIPVWGRAKEYSFLSDGTGWMVVEDAIFRTSDWAKTWTRIPSKVPIWFVNNLESDHFQLRFTDHQTGWLFVPWLKNKLLRTRDGGKSWERLF